MKRLNREAGALAAEIGLRGGTDVTGFGLIGHATEMAKASGVGLHFGLEKIPFASCARKYAALGTFPGGAADNRLYFGPGVRFAARIAEEMQMLLFDPQTSGGLLLGVPPARLAAFMSRAAKVNQPAWVIGEAVKGEGIDVSLR
jgi:selenide,water dikinase